MNDDLRIALELADRADAITLRHFQTAFAVRMKKDHTPVSVIDEEVERAIRERLQRERADDAIVGEEFGTDGRNAARRWVIDTIDATSNYIRGNPVFATLIALDGSVGVVSAPALGRRWSAARGEGAFCNGRPIGVSDTTDVKDAHLGYDSIKDFDDDAAMLELMRRCARTRAFGDFWIHMLVAEGVLDIAIEPRVAWWDVAAVQVIIEEAGGRFTTLGGEARADGGSGVSTNGLLHTSVLDALRQR